jgi:serine/threonine-protein kinase HipA
MAVRSKNPHWKLSEINARHWIETAKRCGIADIVSRTPAVIERVGAAIPQTFPAQIADTILDRVSSERLQSELSGKG